MKVGWLQLILLIICAASAAAVPRLGESAPFYLVVPAMFVCVVSCWLLIFENSGMQRTRGLGQFLLYGFLVPRWSNWSKPVELSFNGWVVGVSAAVMVGALLGMFWMVYA